MSVMKDIFEFKILMNENAFDDTKADHFICFIESYSVCWGGGHSSNQINGSLYADENVTIYINEFVEKFINFFLNFNVSIESIEINIEDFYFHSFDYNNFIKSYPSLPIHIGHWKI